MNEEPKQFLSKKRNKVLSLEKNCLNNNDLNHKSDNIDKDKYKDILTLNYHSHWINNHLMD